MTVDAPDYPELEPYGARIDRAVYLFEEFGRVWAEYLEQRPHRLATEIDANGHGTLRMKRVVPLPPELTLVLGEFLYQLRAALDNCIYAVAVIDSGTNPPPGASALQWPICDTPEAFEKQRPRLKHLHSDLVEALETIQPYQAELPAWNSLRILNELARVDRHRSLHLVTLVTLENEVTADLAVIKNLEFHADGLHDGGVIASSDYLGEGELGPQHIDGDFEFEVGIADVEFSVGPTGEVMQPWVNLEKRMRSLHQAVVEYADGLIDIALAPATDPEGRGDWRGRRAGRDEDAFG